MQMSELEKVFIHYKKGKRILQELDGLTMQEVVIVIGAVIDQICACANVDIFDFYNELLATTCNVKGVDLNFVNNLKNEG